MSEIETSEKVTFADLGLSERLLKAVSEMGFEEPSPIQATTIPMLLAGRDLVGQAQTGTGKTAAFGAPMIEGLDTRVRGIQGLVLTPTRELAIQVAEEVRRLGRHARARVVPIYGGQAIERQTRLLAMGANIVVGTPGRVMDLMRRGYLKFENLHFLVLDEADEMLDMGFIEDVEWIMAQTPAERQTMLFSATISEQIQKLARRYMREPEYISISPQQLTVPLIDQFFYEVRPVMKLEALCRILDMENVERGIIFCRTKKGVDELTEAVQARGYLAEGIHGDLTQHQRTRVMQKFRQGNIELLIATDVAARGLDIEGVSHVINFDVPQDPESYVHRIGRTGRAGRSGTGITLITSREFPQLRLIERAVRQRILRRPLPSETDVAEKQRQQLRDRVMRVLEAGHLGPYREIAQDLLQSDFSAEEVVAATLRLAAGDENPATAAPTDFGETGAEAGMVRFFLNLGRANAITPADIVRGIASQAGIPGSAIGSIDIYDRFTFVEVPKDLAAQVYTAMQESTIKGRTVSIEPARKR